MTFSGSRTPLTPHSADPPGVQQTARHLDGESIRTIAHATKLSIGTVHTVIADHRAANDN